MAEELNMVYTNKIKLNCIILDGKSQTNWLYFDEILNGHSEECKYNGLTPYLNQFFNGKPACIFTHGMTGPKNTITSIVFILRIIKFD